jgi:hypothetical protein
MHLFQKQEDDFVNVARSRAAHGALVAMAVTAAILSYRPAAAESCSQPSDQMALNTRVLQTELMVGALACKNQNLYNKFVVKYRGQLVEQGQSLRAMFDRRHGKGGTTRMNALVTKLANEASQRSVAQRYGFCRQSALLFAKALADDKPDLNGLIEVAAEHGLDGVQRCGSTTVAGFGTAAGKSTLDPKVFPKPR